MLKTHNTADLTASGWKDQRGHIISSPTNALFVGSIAMPRFVNGQQTYMNLAFQIQHDMASDQTLLYPHIHWSTDVATSGNVKFVWEYSFADIDGVFPSPTTLTLVQAAAGAFVHTKAIFPGIPIVPEPSSVVLCRIGRLGGDPLDTLAGPVFIYDADIHYLSDRTATSSQIAPWDD